MSPTWEPPEDAYEFGASIGLTTQEVERETAKFRDWHLARRNAVLSADWAATWRLWMRRASERKTSDPMGRQPAQYGGRVADETAWSGPAAVRDVVSAAGLAGYLGYFTWRDLPEPALATTSPTMHAKLKPCERQLREAGWKLLLERAA